MRNESKLGIDKKAEADLAGAAIDAQVVDFLDGRTDGEGLLHALYDHVLDEPIPKRMRALLSE